MKCPCCGSEVDRGYKHIAIDPKEYVIYLHGNAIPLTKIRFGILQRIVDGHGVPVHWRKITEWTYQDDPNGGPESHNNISVQVGNIKKIIEPYGFTIKSSIGYGYWIEEIQ